MNSCFFKTWWRLTTAFLWLHSTRLGTNWWLLSSSDLVRHCRAFMAICETNETSIDFHRLFSCLLWSNFCISGDNWTKLRLETPSRKISTFECDHHGVMCGNCRQGLDMGRNRQRRVNWGMWIWYSVQSNWGSHSFSIRCRNNWKFASDVLLRGWW